MNFERRLNGMAKREAVFTIGSRRLVLGHVDHRGEPGPRGWVNCNHLYSSVKRHTICSGSVRVGLLGVVVWRDEGHVEWRIDTGSRSD